MSGCHPLPSMVLTWRLRSSDSKTHECASCGQARPLYQDRLSGQTVCKATGWRFCCYRKISLHTGHSESWFSEHTRAFAPIAKTLETESPQEAWGGWADPAKGTPGGRPPAPLASKMRSGLRTASGTGSALCREVTSHPGRTYGWAQGPRGVAGREHGSCQKGDYESLD